MTSNFKIAVLLSYICIASISAAIITPALPLIEHSYNLTHGALEWIVSIFLFGYVIGQLIYGPLAKRFGCLNALRCGLVLNLVGICICILAVKFSSYPLLLAGRLVTALGAASGLSCTFMLINKLMPAQQAKHAISFTIFSFTIWVGLAVLLGGVITEYLHWQDCFWLLLAHGFIMLILTWQFTENRTNAQSIHYLHIIKSYLHAFKSKQLIIFALMVGFKTVFVYDYFATAPLYAQKILHLSASQFGYWNLINMLGMFGSGILSTIFMRKYPAKKVIYVGLTLTAFPLISLIILAHSHQISSLWFFITTMFLYLFSGVLFPAASYLASNAIEDKASASSAMSFINMGSAMISVIIIGYLPLSAIVALSTVLGIFFIIMILLMRSKWAQV